MAIKADNSIFDNNSKPKILAKFCIKFGIMETRIIIKTANNQTRAYFMGIHFFIKRYKMAINKMIANEITVTVKFIDIIYTSLFL